MKYVIIPSAKVIPSELQDVGKLPAIIYPIGEECMMDLLKEQYFSQYGDVSFEIVVFEEYKKVFQRIEKASSIHLHKLDALKDVGYSIYYALKNISIDIGDKVIVNFADTIVYDEIDSDEKNNDSCYYSEEDISSRWSYFTETNGIINEIYDKIKDTNSINTNRIMLGVFNISSPQIFLTHLEKAVLSNVEGIDSFYRALRAYSREKPIFFKKAQKWFDLGHLDKYFDMQIAVKSRTFNHISIDKSRSLLTKTSEDIEKFIGEIKWYLKLPVKIEYCRPRIFSYSTSATSPFVEMEYYSYLTLHEIFLYGEITDTQWASIFKQIKFIINDFSKYSFKDEGIEKALSEMYFSKTISRLENYKKNNSIVDFEKPITINGIRYRSLNEIISLLPEVIKKRLLDCDVFQIIHGDLCFTNILVDPKYSFVKLIDPRGSFGKYDIYGDKRYELAKLMHSVDGLYDYIIKDRFELSINENIINYNIFEKDKTSEIYKIFYKIFNEDIENDFLSIKLIESLLFFSMLPLHSESESHQLAMLSTAIKLLDEIINIQEDE